MEPLIGIAAAVLPEIIRVIASDNTGTVAGKVADVVKSATNATDPVAAKQAVESDPQIASDLQVKLAQIALESQTAQNAAAAGARDAATNDTASARATLLELVKTNAQAAWTPPILSFIIVVGFLSMVAFLLSGQATAVSGNQSTLQLVNVCLGAVATGFATVINFWLGSSLGSQKKDATAQLQQAQDIVKEPTPLRPAVPTSLPPVATVASTEAVPQPALGGRAANVTELSARTQGLTKDLEEARKYKAEIEAAAQACSLPSSLICAVGSRESAWGLTLRPVGPAGTGDFARRDPTKWGFALPPDGGWGRGLMQIDYQQPFAKTEDWKDPGKNIEYGSKELADNISFYQNENHPNVDPTRAGVAAYNCGRGNVNKAIQMGRDVDAITTGHDYSADVLKRKAWFDANPL